MKVVGPLDSISGGEMLLNATGKSIGYWKCRPKAVLSMLVVLTIMTVQSMLTMLTILTMLSTPTMLS